MKILLVGGAGFIGHHLAIQLRFLRHDVTVVDGLQVNSFLSLIHDLKGNELYLGFIRERLEMMNDAGVDLVIQDARDYHKMSRIMGNLKPDIVIHLAAVAHANRSNKDPYSTFDHSLQTLEIALDICKSPVLNGCVKQFIYFSSSMVYGNFPEHKTIPEVEENVILRPIGIYGALKQAGEIMVKAYNEIFNIPYTIIRPSALYGPRCISGRVIQKFIENAMKGRYLQVAGIAGESLDFTYINDLVQGVCCAIGHPKAINETFNITYGKARSISEVAQLVQEQFGVMMAGDKAEPVIKILYVDRDKLMPIRGTLSVDKAKQLLGYKPGWPIDTGVKQYLNWYLMRG